MWFSTQGEVGVAVSEVEEDDINGKDWWEDWYLYVHIPCITFQWSTCFLIMWGCVGSALFLYSA